MTEHHDDTLSTGDLAVDAALRRLEELDERPVDEHVAVYEDVHRQLTEALDGSADSPLTEG